MGKYSKKISFERAILNEVNQFIKSDIALISLSENAIKNWWKGVHNKNVNYKKLIEKIAIDYGFIKEESNTLLDFPGTEEELNQILSKMKTLLAG